MPGGRREEVAGRITAVLCGGRGGRSRCDGLVGTESREDLLPRAILRQRHVGEDLCLRVAGVVGGDGDEFVLSARPADEHGLFRPGRQPALPETEAATVLGDVETDRAYPGQLVAALPAQVEADDAGSAGRSSRGDGQMRPGCRGVEPDGVRLTVDRRQRVGQKARGAVDVATGQRVVVGANAVGDEALLRRGSAGAGIGNR
ncbi:MAG: hypothetical protein AW07_04179 [Candidatus Accumulibacter sp. SK-11]|nr:MAG: hypothetical protein AW07_04179 [Candidatus Accumulibacter sp. SK-11]